MIKGIIFDMDGVMIDSERQSNYGWLQAAKQKGVTMPMWLINSFKGAPPTLSKQYFDNYFHGQIDYWDTRELRSHYVRKLRETEGIPVKPGLYELLEYSRQTGLSCAVATSTQRDSAYNTLHIIGAWEYLDAVVFGDEVANGKPAPDIFLKAAAQIGLLPEECIVIEDSINGIQAGCNAKIPVVHVPDTIVIDEELKAHTFAVCKDLQEVIGVIARQNKSACEGQRQLRDQGREQSCNEGQICNGEQICNEGQSPDTMPAQKRTGLDRCALKYLFVNYVAPYHIQEDKIRLKIEHTYQVAALCEQVAKSLHLGAADIDLAWFLGMFHDIGRFEQVKRYDTFYDAESVDHAALSADITFGKATVPMWKENGENSTDTAKLPQREADMAAQIQAAAAPYADMELAELAIRNHNVYRLPDSLSVRERMFCDILRDADKIDILRVCVEEPAEAVYAVPAEDLYNSCISEEVLQSFCRRETVLKRIRKTAADKLVGHISLAYELVYPESLAIAKQQGFLDQMLEFSFRNETANQQFCVIREAMQTYLQEKGCF